MPKKENILQDKLNIIKLKIGSLQQGTNDMKNYKSWLLE